MLKELADLARERFEAMNSFAERFEALHTEAVITCETSKEDEPRVQIYAGIMALAAECGASVERFPRNGTRYPFGFRFNFDGVRFYQCSATEVPE